MTAPKFGPWHVIALAAVVAVVGLGVLFFAPADQRGALIDRAAPFVGSVVTAVLAGLGIMQARDGKHETRAQNDTLDSIAHNVNGNLTARLQATEDATVSRVLSALEDAGVLSASSSSVASPELDGAAG